MSILKGLALVDIIQQLHTCACLLSSLAFCHPLPFVPTLHGQCCSVLRLSVPVHLRTPGATYLHDAAEKCCILSTRMPSSDAGKATPHVIAF